MILNRNLIHSTFYRFYPTFVVSLNIFENRVNDLFKILLRCNFGSLQFLNVIFERKQ